MLWLIIYFLSAQAYVKFIQRQRGRERQRERYNKIDLIVQNAMT